MYHADPVQAFEGAKEYIEPGIVEAFDELGEDAIIAYHSLGLYHNTPEGFLKSILENGLKPDDHRAVPNTDDIEFAETLFAEQLQHDNSKGLFENLVKGVGRGRMPGVFFYGIGDEDRGEYHKTYGVPERLYVLAQEMGVVMLDESGRFTKEERDRARQAYETCKHKLEDAGSAIRVVQADPFSPNVISARLGNLPNIMERTRGVGKEILHNVLGNRFALDWGGLYVPGGVLPQHLREVPDVQIPMPFTVTEEWVRGSTGRFS